MANNLWSNYTEKTVTPVDADEVMVRDSTDGNNKRLLFGTFWKWVAKKLNEATISELETENKTVIGALNYLNGNPLSILAKNAILLEQAFDYNELKTTGVYYLTGNETSSSDNRPNDDCTNCYLLIFAYSTVRVTQIVLPGNYHYVLYRSLITDTNTWLEWKTIK